MKKLKALAVVLALGITICGCSPAEHAPDVQGEDPASSPSAGYDPGVQGGEPSGGTSASSPSSQPSVTPPSATGSRGTMLSRKPDGELSIVRLNKGTPSAAPKDGIWTVFAYVCGADLESKSGQATRDINEMISATRASSKLRFVVEAGGANTWNNNYCVSGKNTRLLISGGSVKTFASNTANMGDPNTLADFLDWGLTNYRSQYIAVDFWDHGGSSISGVCFDERYQSDGLSLLEMDKALAALYKKHAVAFDLIGYDACLMATIETANILVPYAKYMIASEELEPGTGWEYNGFGAGVNAGAKSGAEMGKYICDYYKRSVGENPTATLSVVDLSAIDQFLLGFNSYCIDIYDYICKNNGIDNIMKSTRGLPSFGDGGYNSTDLGLFIHKTSGFSSKADRAYNLMKKCVVYMVNGTAYNNATGIAVYFPLSAPKGSKHLNILKDICVTPYYLGIVDVCAYGISAAGNISGYDPNEWIDEDSEYWTENDVNENNYNYWNNNTQGTLNINGTSGISFTQAPYHKDPLVGFDKYAFTLSREGLKNVNTVYTNLFSIIKYNNNEVLVDFGASYVGSGDYYRANNILTVEEQFYGMSVGLRNAGPLSIHPLARTYVDGYGYVNFYYAPISYNGSPKNLVFYEYYTGQDPTTWVPTAPRYIAVGTTNFNIGEMASRVEPLKKGDTIIPVFPAYDAKTMKFVDYLKFNVSYTCQSDGDLRLDWNVELSDGLYKWMYYITDIYGNAIYTNPVTCKVDHSGLWPYSIVG